MLFSPIGGNPLFGRDQIDPASGDRLIKSAGSAELLRFVLTTMGNFVRTSDRVILRVRIAGRPVHNGAACRFAGRCALA